MLAAVDFGIDGSSLQEAHRAKRNDEPADYLVALTNRDLGAQNLLALADFIGTDRKDALECRCSDFRRTTGGIRLEPRTIGSQIYKK